MTLDEAIAIYLALRNRPPGDRSNPAFMAAWSMIVKYAEAAIKRYDHEPPTSENG